VASYGLLTVAGLISFVLGSLMLFDAPIPDMRVSLAVVLPTALMIAGVTVFLLSRVVKVHSRPPVTGEEGLVGEVGQAVSEIAPFGKVKVHGEWWDARGRGGSIAPGARIRVVAINGRELLVEAADATEGSTA
jgi:membrane-bound serine protease (ClpP class)